MPERTELGDQGHQGGGGDRADPRDGGQQPPLSLQLLRLCHGIGDPALERLDRLVEPGQVLFDVDGDLGDIAALQPGALLLAGVHQLVAAPVQCRQPFASGIGRSLGSGLERRAQGGEPARIHLVGLGQEARGAGEVAGAARVDAGVSHAEVAQGLAQVAVVDAGGLKHHQGLLVGPEPGQRFDGLTRIGAARSRTVEDVEPRFGDVDPDDNRVYVHESLSL